MLAIFTHVCQHCHIWNAKKPYNWDFSLKPLAFLRVSPYAPKRKFVGSNPAGYHEERSMEDGPNGTIKKAMPSVSSVSCFEATPFLC